MVNGWRKACDLADAAWGGGETPVLKGIIRRDTIDLAGSAFGIIKPKKRLISEDKIKVGDDIIFLESSGIHANGLTLARKILGKIKNKRYFAELLLNPTIIYAKVIDEILNSGIDIHYLVNITGHGLRKLMRAKKAFAYKISNPGTAPEIFRIIQKESRLTDSDMYATFNMGAGYAIYVNPKDSRQLINLSKKNGIKAWVAGKVLEGKKTVSIPSLKISYNAGELRIRN